VQERGINLAKYLATRLVYHELKQELFGNIYKEPGAAAGAALVSPRGGAATPAAPADDDSDGPSCLTLQTVIQRKAGSLSALVSQIPLSLLTAFTIDVCDQLTNAWIYVVVDACRRQKLDQISPYLEDDFDSLKDLVRDLTGRARKRIQTERKDMTGPDRDLHGMNVDDLEAHEKHLGDKLNKLQPFVYQASDGKAEDLAKVAARLCGDVPDAQARGSRDDRRSPRDASPAGGPLLIKSGSELDFERPNSARNRQASPRPGPVPSPGANDGEEDSKKKRSMFSAFKKPSSFFKK